MPMLTFTPAAPATPAAPSGITQGGTGGSTHYFYELVAHNQFGTSAVGAEGTTAGGNATLNSTNYNIVPVPALANGVTSYDLYAGTTTGGENRLVAAGVTTTNVHDTGQGTAATPPSAAVVTQVPDVTDIHVTNEPEIKIVFPLQTAVFVDPELLSEVETQLTALGGTWVEGPDA